jgi:hypothetical protein
MTDRGNHMHAGAYLVRLESVAGTATTPLVWIP